MSINNDLIEIALNSPITEEQWDAITDIDFENTNRIWFHTKHGKDVEFAKVVRCMDCKYRISSDCKWDEWQAKERTLDSFCSFGKRKEEKQNE